MRLTIPNLPGRVLESSGAPAWDNWRDENMQRLNSFWGLPTRVYFLEESGGSRGANALSLPQGVIVFGLYLIQRLGPFGPYSILGALAHEYGHQVQFASPQAGEHRQPFVDLEADALAGVYLGCHHPQTWEAIEGALNGFYSLGDIALHDSDHHGTPYQRLSSARMGYQLAYCLSNRSVSIPDLRNDITARLRVTFGADGLRFGANDVRR